VPYVDVDGVQLYYEETGAGDPILFVHEYAGDLRSWEPQVRCFARMYRCITYNARGYPPSEVPDDGAAYSQDIATDDIAGVLRGLGIPSAHIVGLSMGAFAGLHFGLRYPEMARSLVLAGGGYGALDDNHAKMQDEAGATADKIQREGMAVMAETYALGPSRLAHKRKDPRGWAEFKAQLAEHSAAGAARTMRGVQMTRPAYPELVDRLHRLTVPVLLVAGDEDEPSIDPTIYLKRNIPSAAMTMLPKTGHNMNLEEPELFNRAVQDFLTTVTSGQWEVRDLASITGKIL
jgi:pimeloyl-ACP methyl ester carboxylesterase